MRILFFSGVVVAGAFLFAYHTSIPAGFAVLVATAAGVIAGIALN